VAAAGKKKKPKQTNAGIVTEAFCRALWRHDDAVIAKLAPSVDPNASDRWGNTPLLSAAQYGDASLVTLLLRRGAHVDQNRSHLTPLTLAAKRHDEVGPAIVSVLAKKHAKSSIFTTLHLRDAKALKRMLGKSRDLVTAIDEEGTPLLLHAADTLDADLILLLLDHGAPIDTCDANGVSALHRVADHRQAPQANAEAAARVLIEHGANVNARNWDDVTPLHQAVRARNLSVTKILLLHGADANAKDKGHGSTPLRRAISSTGASATAGTKSLMLPLATLLLDYGADPCALDKRGVSVYESASSDELREVLTKRKKKTTRR
jgi:ankyrin repeat protein